MELRVRVISAKKLPAMDAIGKSDPYVKLLLRGREAPHFKTDVKKDTKKPKWEQDFTFDVPSYHTDIMKLQMYDQDIARDDKMGKLNIKVALLHPGQVIDQWYDLKPTKSCKKPGMIHLGLQACYKGTGPWTPTPFTPLQVNISIIKAKDLAKMDTIGNSDPFCKVSLKGTSQTYTTKVKENTLKPKWEENVSFLLNNPTTDVVHILVKDKDVAGDDDMATVDIPLAQYATGTPIEAWHKMNPAKGVKKGGEIQLLIQCVPAPAVSYANEQTGVILNPPKRK
jgi:Ca2+-dependent lipid-binding protein